MTSNGNGFSSSNGNGYPNGLCNGSARLTGRQLDVLRLVALGNSNAEIARALYVSPSTVKTTVTQLSRRLGARSRAHAVHRGWENGLLV